MSTVFTAPAVGKLLTQLNSSSDTLEHFKACVNTVLALVKLFVSYGSQSFFKVQFYI